MWQQNVTKVLANLGWGSGFRLPIASAENLELERELEKRHRLIQKRQAELEDLTKHTEILERGIKNTTDHIHHDKKLVAAKRTEMASEIELLKLTEREGHKLAKEYKLTQRAFKKIIAKNQELVTEIETRKQDLAELAELIEYDRKELTQLEKKYVDENQYLRVIEDLSDLDSETLRKYEKRYKKATEDTIKQRLDLEGKVALTRVLQAELDGLGSRFRKLHAERGEIVHLWKETLDSLTNRDDDMRNIAEEYAETDFKLKEKTTRLEQERSKLTDHGQSSTTASLQLGKWDRKVMDVRDAIKNVTEMNQDLKDSVFSFESAISCAAKQTLEVSDKCAEIDKEIAQKTEKYLQTLEAVHELREKAAESSNKIQSVSERMKELNTMVDEEEKKLESLGKYLEKEMIKKCQWVNKKGLMDKNDKDLSNEIRGAKNNLNVLTSKTKECTFTLERSQSTIYKIELEKISLELKFLPINDPKAHDSRKYEEDERKIVELKLELEEISRQKSFISAQVTNLVNINRRVYRERIATDKEIVVLDAKSNEHRSYVKFLMKHLKDMLEEYRNAVVDSSLVRLKLTQMTKTLNEQKNMLYDSGHQRSLLQAAAKEKRTEIEEHSRLLELRCREIKEELSQLRMQLGNVNQSLDKKRKRYEMVMKLMANPSDSGSSSEVDEIKSEAYYVLKMAQERELLRMEGDKWDKQVKDAEVETEALQNSLAVIQCSNDLFKDSLKPIGNDGYSEEMNKLKEKEREVFARKSKAITNMRKLQDELQSKLDSIEIAQHQKVHLENKAVDLEYELRVLQGELSNQVLSVKRVRIATNKLLHQLSFSGPQEKQIISLDIKLKATKRKFEFGTQTLAKLLTVQPFLYEMMGKLLSQHFGEDVAVKFLKRVSPMTGDVPSPSGSQRGTKSALARIMSRENLSPSRSVSTMSVSSSVSVTQKQRIFQSMSAIVSSKASIIGYVEDVPDRTVSEKQLLAKMDSAMREERKIVLQKRITPEVPYGSRASPEDSSRDSSLTMGRRKSDSSTSKSRPSLLPKQKSTSSSTLTKSITTILSTTSENMKSSSTVDEPKTSDDKLETIEEQDDGGTVTTDIKEDEE